MPRHLVTLLLAKRQRRLESSGAMAGVDAAARQGAMMSNRLAVQATGSRT